MMSEMKSLYVEIEVQSRYYRPAVGKWYASGRLTVGNRTQFWQASKNYSEWVVEPDSALKDSLSQGELERVGGLVAEALETNRRYLIKTGKHGSRATAPSRDRIETIRLADDRSHDVLNLAQSEEAALTLQGKARKRAEMLFVTIASTVSPVFFPGGDIGSLTVAETVNKIAVAGALPIAVRVSIVVEDGFSLSQLKRIMRSIGKTASEAEVTVTTSELRVVESGAVDGLFINGTGIGYVQRRGSLSLANALPGDVVILSGGVAEHQVAVLAERKGLSFRPGVRSDVAPLNKLITELIQSSRSMRCIRCVGAGGVAGVLNKIARCSGTKIVIRQDAIPIKAGVAAAVAILGLDPLYLGSAGRVLLVCSKNIAKQLLAIMRKYSCSRDAAIIGEVCRGEEAQVVMELAAGGTRIISVPMDGKASRIY